MPAGTEFEIVRAAQTDAGAEHADAAQPEIPAEEFIESIPFTETRLYVMTILAMQEQYRRIYALSAESRTASDAR